MSAARSEARRRRRTGRHRPSNCAGPCGLRLPAGAGAGL